MNIYIPSFEYLGILVQGGIIFYFLVNALFLFIIMPKLQPKRNKATVAIHKSLVCGSFRNSSNPNVVITR